MQIVVPCVPATHPRQHRRGPRLHREMQVPAYLRQRSHRRDHAVADMTRMRTRKPDALNSRHAVHQLEQPREVAAGPVGGRVVIHDLPEKMDLAVSAVGGKPDFVDDLRGRPHPLVASCIGHDTERAEIVAALDNRDRRPDRVRTPGHSQRERYVVIGVDVDALRPVAGQPLDHRRQPAESLGADDEIHPLPAFEQGASFLLRDTAGHGHDRAFPGAAAGHHAELGVQPFLRPFPDAAGVDDDEIRIVDGLGRLVSRLIEQTGQTLGVVHVHLAAERFDEVLPGHGCIPRRCRRRAHGARRLRLAGVSGDSSSRALSNTVPETRVPVIILAISEARDSSSNRCTSASVRPLRTDFVTR